MRDLVEKVYDDIQKCIDEDMHPETERLEEWAQILEDIAAKVDAVLEYLRDIDDSLTD